MSEAGVESGAMDGGAWNPESCPRYTANSICYKEAESIAMRWIVHGDIPERINSKAEKANSQSVDRISLFNSDWKPFSL